MNSIRIERREIKLETGNYNYVVDILRFAAAFMVVIFHLNLTDKPSGSWYEKLSTYGWLGVPMFFVISGYCIMISANNSIGSLEFLMKRFFRIFPAYWFSLVLVILAAILQKVVTGTNSVHSIPASPVTILANLSLLTWPFSDVIPMNYPYWSLTCELFFYIIIGILLMLPVKWSKYFLIGISGIAIFFIEKPSGYLFFLKHWPAFGCGLSLFHILYKPKDIFPYTLLLFNATAVIITFYTFYKIEEVVAITITFCLILFTSKIKTSNTFFSTMGKYSYSVYLIHVPIGIFIIGFFFDQHSNSSIPFTIFRQLLTYAVISGCACLMYYQIEKRFIKYGKKFYEGRNTINRP